MADDKQPLITNNFLKHLARGGIKSIPVVGSLIDEMIFGTLEGEAAAAESAKLASTLSALQSRVDLQSATLADVLTKANAAGDFQPVVREGINDLVMVLGTPDGALVSAQTVTSVARLLTRHAIPLAEIESHPDQTVRKLEQAASTVSHSVTTTNIGSTRPQLDRIGLINFFNGLTNDDLEMIIISMPGASSHITENASVRRRVSELIRWADSATGPGLPRLYEVAYLLLFP